jgi:hypothetical protein
VLAHLWNAFPDLIADVRIVCANSECAVWETTLRGTHTGDLTLGETVVRASGRLLALDLLVHGRIQAGQLTSERVYFDQLTLLRQLGV